MSQDSMYERVMNQLVKERRSGTLTKLDPAFFPEAEAYVAELEETYRRENAQNPASPKANLLGVELLKLRSGIEDFYETREKKTLLQALRAAWDKVAERQNMLPWEAEMFERIVHALRDTRRTVLKGRERRSSAKVVDGSAGKDAAQASPSGEASAGGASPSASPAAASLTDASSGSAGAAAPASTRGLSPGSAQAPGSTQAPGSAPASEPGFATAPIPAAAPAHAGSPASTPAAGPSSEPPASGAVALADGPGAATPPGTGSASSEGAPVVEAAPVAGRVMIHVLETVDPFTASDMRTYRLDREDVVAVPPEIAKLLIARKKARAVVPSSDLASRS